MQCHIMIADHDSALLNTAKQELSKAGYSISTVKDWQGLMDIKPDHQPELLLLDEAFISQDINSRFSEIHSNPNWQSVPIIMLANGNDQETLMKSQQAGVYDFVTKPIDWKLLSCRLQYMVAAVHEKSELQSTIQSLQHSETKLLNAQRIARMGYWQYDHDTNKVLCSEQVRQIFDYPIQQEWIPLENFIDRIPGEEQDCVANTIQEVYADHKSRSIEHRILLPDDTVKFVHQQMDVQQVQNETESNAVLVAGLVQDITERRDSERKIYYMANYDHLTNLPNRQNFKRQAEAMLKQVRDGDKHLAILFLDVDNFKKINDTLGHSIGDRLLEQFAARMQKVCEDFTKGDGKRKTQVVASRFGGDEFTILLSSEDAVVKSASLSERLLDVFREPFYVENRQIVTSVSVGISVYPDDGEFVGALLKNADTAMYHAKTSGKNCYRYYSSSMNAKALERFTMENYLRNAIKNKELLLYYQPKICSATRNLCGLEALLRWKHPQFGLLLPDEFIPIAEQTNLIVTLGEWVIEEACTQLKTWIDRGNSNIKVSVNVSGRQFKNPDFVSLVTSIIKKHKLPFNSLEIEITESTIMNDVERSIETINLFKKNGVLISIDDFGKGYSSFSYLQDLPLDLLKIDRMFVDTITQEDSGRAIVKAMIDMSHAMGLRVIAEGVETAEQSQLLESFGCDMMQGLYFSPPLSSENIDKEYMNASKATTTST